MPLLPSISFCVRDYAVVQALNRIVFSINDNFDSFTLTDLQHGNRSGGTLHADATPLIAGFMSAADKVILDGFATGSVPSSRQIITNGGLVGGGDLSANRTIGVVANADGSMIVNADDIQVGVISDGQHGPRGGGALHLGATQIVAGFMSTADKIKLDNFPASAVPTSRTLTAGAGMTGGGDLTANRTFNVVANADGSIVVNPDDIQVGVINAAQHGNLAGGALHASAISAGASGFLTGADKARLDAMTIPDAKTFRVSTTVGAGQYTSVRQAILDAIAAGASQVNPYEIVISPGNYTELPMNVIPGISVTADQAQRMGEVNIIAQNPAADLFTCTGGYVGGLRAQGTDATHCLFRLATAGTNTVFHGVSIRTCTAGIIVSNGAACVLNSFSILLDGAGQAVGTAVQVTGVGSYLAGTGCFFVVPAALLPLYPGTNPLERCISVNAGARAIITSSVFRVSYNVATSAAVFADGGGDAIVLASDFAENNNAFEIGSFGAGTTITTQACYLRSNNLNVNILSGTGVVFAQFTADTRAYFGVAGAQQIGITMYEDVDQIRLLGNAQYEFPSSKLVNLADFFSDYTSTGVCDDGLVTDAGGLFVNVGSGDGWIVRGAPDEDSFWVNWAPSLNLPVAPNATNYIVYDSASSTIVALVAPPSNLQILLATAITDAGDIRFLHNTRTGLYTPQNQICDYLNSVQRIAWSTGLAITAGTTNRKFKIDPGMYYVSLTKEFVDGSLSLDATWSSFYGPNWATENAGVTQIDITNYDNAGVMAALGVNFRADTLFITSDNRLCLVYGTTPYATQLLAEAAPIANVATFAEPTACALALIIVEGGNGIVSRLDRRPQPGATAYSAAGGVTNHHLLSGLLLDDHPQYMLVTGGRAMTGNLDMGGNNVVNVGLLDGVDISAHAARHDPGGLDALAVGMPVAVLVGAVPDPGVGASYALNDHQHGMTVGVPVTIGTANAPGGSGDVSRADHVHAHGAQVDGTLHALAVAAGASGFMSGADKTKLDGLPATWVTPARNLTAGAGLTGGGNLSADRTFNVVANADGSIVVNADDIQVGVITDAQHGNRAGGALHPAAVSAGANGFMTGADKLKLDGVAVGATATVITAAAPANVTKFAASAGIVMEAARADHKHDITTAAAVTTGLANSEGASTALSRADHGHIAAPPTQFVQSTVSTTTIIAADAVMLGMSITPAAGTYMVWFSGNVSIGTNNRPTFMSIYSAGVQILASERGFNTNNASQTLGEFNCYSIVTVNGAQAIEGQWRTTVANTATNTRRQLIIMRVS